ncbi:MAG TPA: FAD-dependent monooxygenase [Solirubrobacterales bacterium]|nr:FAD-dependent monooxygenase [Solirubrobacterales bacterium]
MLVEKVQVAGGGIAGLAAGVALRDRGVEVEIHEKFAELQGRATGFSIWAYAIKRLMEWGFDRERLDSIGREIVESHIVDGKDRPLLTLPVREASAEVGAPSMDVDRRRLQEAMIELIGAERYRFASEVTGVEEGDDGVALILADGSRAEGDLVLGGDGVHSVIRDRVLEQSVDLKRSRYEVIEGLAPFDERYLPRGQNKQVWGSKARCGVGWVSDEKVRWFLGGRGIALAGDPPLSKDELLARVDGMPNIVSAVLEATDEAQIVRTEVRHGYPPKSWHAGRTVLLGDAAHTLSPFAGMGACSTIEDVDHLVRLLEESPSLDDALSTFQREREGDVAKIEKTGRRNEQMMMPSNPLFYWTRNEVLGHTPDEKLLSIAEGMTSDES